MRKIVSFLLLAGVIFISTGCMRVYGTYTVNDDGTLTVTTKQALSKEFIDEAGGTTEEGLVLETLEDGKEYYTGIETKSGAISELNTSSNMTINKDIFYYSMNSSGDETTKTTKDISDAIANSIYLKLTVNLTDEIVDTNANLKEETSGKTAVFDTTFVGSSWYAYTAKGKQMLEADVTAPTISNVEEGGYYNLIPDIQYTDDVAVASVTINGLPYTQVLTKDGKNVLTVTDVKGNQSSVTFYTDRKRPVIKGIKNGRSYKGSAKVYVKDESKLGMVKIDGKKQSLSAKKLVKKGKYKKYYMYTIKKKGKHTVTAVDRAGNINKIVIKIR